VNTTTALCSLLWSSDPANAARVRFVIICTVFLKRTTVYTTSMDIISVLALPINQYLLRRSRRCPMPPYVHTIFQGNWLRPQYKVHRNHWQFWRADRPGSWDRELLLPVGGEATPTLWALDAHLSWDQKYIMTHFVHHAVLLDNPDSYYFIQAHS